MASRHISVLIHQSIGRYTINYFLHNWKLFIQNILKIPIAIYNNRSIFNVWGDQVHFVSPSITLWKLIFHQPYIQCEHLSLYCFIYIEPRIPENVHFLQKLRTYFKFSPKGNAHYTWRNTQPCRVKCETSKWAVICPGEWCIYKFSSKTGVGR